MRFSHAYKRQHWPRTADGRWHIVYEDGTVIRPEQRRAVPWAACATVSRLP